MEILNEPAHYFLDSKISDSLLNMIERANLDNDSAHSTFYFTATMLKEHLDNFNEDDYESRRLQNSIDQIETLATKYFENYFTEEFKGLTFPEMLNKIADTLSQPETRNRKFFRQAILSLQKKIEFRDTNELYPSQIYEPENADKNHTIEKKILKKHKDITLDRATLFINYLLDFANEKSRDNFRSKNKTPLKDADKNRIIDFLTPFSGTQSKKLHKPFKDEIAKIAEKEEISEKFYKDMKIVRKYFEMLGLSEILDKIDADLGEK